MGSEAPHQHLVVHPVPGEKKDQHGQICYIHRHSILSIDNIHTIVIIEVHIKLCMRYILGHNILHNVSAKYCEVIKFKILEHIVMRWLCLSQ